MSSSRKSADAPLAADGGVRLPIPAPADPYLALDDLMCAVEALCPVWPERPPFPAKLRILL